MSSSVQPVPKDYEGVIPYLVVDGADAAIDFYCKVFDGEELFRMNHEGKVGHAELRIGGRIMMIADAHPEQGIEAPGEQGGAVGLMLYVHDVDAVVERAHDKGATVNRPAEDQFYGDRMAGIIDPFGHRWYLATHIEDIDADELQRRMDAQSGA